MVRSKTPGIELLLIAVVLVALAACTHSVPSKEAPQDETSLEKCRFTVSSPLFREADVIYVVSFSVDSEGRPSQHRVLKDYAEISEEETRQCLDSWRLRSIANAERAIVLFSWNRYVQWEHVRIIEEGGEFQLDLQFE